MSSVILCPPYDDHYPTLGGLVCDFIEEHLCYGPGDLLGVRVVLNPEQRAWIQKMYEVEPQFLFTKHGRSTSKTRNPRAGKRRFQRCAISLRKGSCKTEFAAWIAACELHPDGPVRCDGFRPDGSPIPKPVSDPYIPMISYSEEQTEELAYGALRRILEECPIGNDFDIGLERIMRRSGAGKAEAVSASPNARDGARTTFQHADETHRFTLEHLRKGWTVMLNNLAKRPLADPWALETTTAPEPGAGSVAESTMEYARELLKGNANNARLFFYHRQASDKHDITTEAGRTAAVVEASGPYIAEWSDIDRIVASYDEPDADRAYWERVWTNRLVQASGRAFDIDQWRALKSPYRVPDGSAIALGFDGGRFDDATALVATHIQTGHQWPIGIWLPPATANMTDEQRKKVFAAWFAVIHGAVSDAFERYHVCRMYCDPPKWEDTVSAWAGKYGDKVVAEWWTNRRKPMAYAIRSFITAINTSALSHDGDKQLDDHIGNALQAPTGLVDEEEKPLWVLRKERPDSPKKIDGAMAAVLSWEAMNDAVAAGEGVVGDFIYVG